MTPEFDVIVVTTYDNLARLTRCLFTIRDMDLGWKVGRTRLTLMANAAPLCEPDSFVDEDNGYREFCVGHNAGWVRAVNAGLSLATAPHVVLCNDDIEVQTDNWLEKMREPFLADPKIAAVGPRSTPNQGRQGELEAGPWRHCLDAGGLFELTGKKPHGVADFQPSHEWGIGRWPLSFFCVMFSQESLKEVGMLDWNLPDGYGGDDDDWQRRAWERGWRFAYQPEVMVAHEGNATFRGRKAELQPRNLEYLRRKWGRA